MNDESTRYLPQNVTTVLEPDVEPDNLEQDKVHLNKSGRQKLASRIIEQTKRLKNKKGMTRNRTKLRCSCRKHQRQQRKGK